MKNIDRPGPISPSRHYRGDGGRGGSIDPHIRRLAETRRLKMKTTQYEIGYIAPLRRG